MPRATAHPAARPAALLALALLLALTSLPLACYPYQAPQPPVSRQPDLPPAAPSVLALRVDAPIAELEAAANAALPLAIDEQSTTVSLTTQDVAKVGTFFSSLPFAVNREIEERVLSAAERWVKGSFGPFSPNYFPCLLVPEALASAPVVTAFCYDHVDAVYTFIKKTVPAVEKFAKAQFTDAIPKLPTGVQVTLVGDARVERVAMRMVGDSLIVSGVVTLSAAVSGGLPFAEAGIVSCGRDGAQRPELNVTLPSRVRLDQTGNLAFDKGRLEYAFTKPCKITAADINFDGLLRSLRLDDNLNDAIQKALEKADLTQDLQKRYADAWEELRKPQPIVLGGLQADTAQRDTVWLRLRPQNITLTGPRGDGTMLSVGLNVGVAPEIVLGPPPAPDPTPFPGVRPGAAEDTFRLRIAGSTTREAANRALEANFRESTIDTPFGDLVINRAVLTPRGDQVAVGLRVRRPFRGWIFATGTLATSLTDPSEIVVSQLDYTLETKNYLARAANWVLQPIVLRLVEQRLRIPLRSRIDTIAVRLAKKPIEIKKLGKLYLALTDLRPAAIRLDQESVSVVVDATGTARGVLDVKALTGGPELTEGPISSLPRQP